MEYVFNATGHLPAGLLARPLEQMTLAWDGIENGDHLAKLSVNSLIGLMEKENLLESANVKIGSSQNGMMIN